MPAPKTEQETLRIGNLIFSTHADPGSIFAGYASVSGIHSYQHIDRGPYYYRVEVAATGDTHINGYRMPYVDVRMRESNDDPLHRVFLCTWQNKIGGYYYYRLYRDLISTAALFSDGSAYINEVMIYGCGLRCFTHPQLGTIRFDSPERQAQFPDCYYGDPVSRPGRAAAALDLSLRPNPATDGVAVEFAGWGQLEA